jgi:hypothetical protein
MTKADINTYNTLNINFILKFLMETILIVRLKNI